MLKEYFKYCVIIYYEKYFLLDLKRGEKKKNGKK